jgi:hypothetical protein
MEGYCSKGQSPQRAVVPVEEEEEYFGRDRVQSSGIAVQLNLDCSY